MSRWMLPLFVCSLLAGCKGKDENTAERAGQAVGAAVTDFASGVTQGVDEKLAVNVELSPQCAEAGLTKTVANSIAPEKGFTVYILAKQPYVGQLVARAVNEAGSEVGRSKVDVEFAADDAQYVKFLFDRAMDSQLVAKYTIDAQASDPAKPDDGSPAPGAVSE